MNDRTSDLRADRVAATATGLGAGLVAFMLSWIISARISERLIDPPGSAYAAMAGALCIGAIVTVWVGHRLRASVEPPLAREAATEATAGTATPTPAENH